MRPSPTRPNFAPLTLRPSGTAPSGQAPRRTKRSAALNPRATRTHLLEIVGSVTGGRLHLRFTYSEARHRAATIEAFAAGFIEALRGLIAHCLSPDAGGATPSDFQNASVTQDMIDMLAGFDPGMGGDGDGDDDGEEDDDLEQD